MEVTSAAAAAQNSKSSLASAGLADNFDTFLTLLTAQLQNQDPLEPLDTNEFTSQLVQFTSVEQSIATNGNLEQLLTMTRVGLSTDAVNYLNKEIVAEGNEADLADGEASWDLRFDSEAVDLTFVVTDAAGKVVYKEDRAQHDAGNGTFTWDGKDNNGNALDDGTYKLDVKAEDTEGNDIDPAIMTSGVVTGVDLSGSEAILTVNGREVPLSTVLKIKEQDAPASQT